MGSRSDECRLRAPLKVHRALIFEGGEKTNYAKMDAIKKKMQAMKLEKDNAMDRADACEQQAKDANLRAEKAEEEVRDLQKKMQQLESDLDAPRRSCSTPTRSWRRKRRLCSTPRERSPLSTGVSRCSRRIWRSQRRGSSSPPRSSTRLLPLPTTTSACARCWRTRACQMSPGWRPWRTS